MNWGQLCDDATLEDIPYRIELSRQGQLIISPRRSYHSIFQSRIIRHLNQLLPQGEAMPECPIETDIGTVVADVAWGSPEKVKRNFDLAGWKEAPEIVAEVLSDSNSEAEILNKRNATFAKGAVEFWVCDRTGKIQFYTKSGQTDKSVICPEFPVDLANG